MLQGVSGGLHLDTRDEIRFSSGLVGPRLSLVQAERSWPEGNSFTPWDLCNSGRAGRDEQQHCPSQARRGWASTGPNQSGCFRSLVIALFQSMAWWNQRKGGHSSTCRSAQRVWRWPQHDRQLWL